MLLAVAEDSPLVRLTYAILLSAVRKHADTISLDQRDGAGLVTFVIGGEVSQEMAPPQQVIIAMVRRLSIMANLRVYGRDEEAEGELALQFESGELATFSIRAFGHGESLGAVLRRLPGPRARPLVRGAYR